MGDYASVRFRAELTPEGAAAVAPLTRPPWAEWAELEGFEDYGALDRADSVPYGAVAYAPHDWEHENQLDGASWSVCCSVKKPYDDEVIRAFLGTVLPRLLAYPCEVELWDELTRELRRELVLPA